MFNQATLIGHVGADPEFRTTPSGKQFANIRMATSKKWTNKQTGEVQEDTQWHRVTIGADGLISVVERFVKKGSKIMVQGEIRHQKWTDKDGIERFGTEIMVGTFGGRLVLLDKREGAGTGEAMAQASSGDLDDEIPF